MDQTRAAEVMAMGVWQDAAADNGFVSRIPTKDMSEKEISDTMKALKKMGFSPKLHDSASLGQTIRLQGIDAINLTIMRNSFIAQLDWHDTKTDTCMISRVATKDMDEGQIKAVSNALKSENLVVVEAKSDKWGPTLRVENKDVEKLKALQKDYAPGKMRFIDKPKDDFGKKFMRAFNKVAARVEKFVEGLKPKFARVAIKPNVGDPRYFAGIWERDAEGNLRNILEAKAKAVVPAMKTPGK